jgi:thioesterase domain-containing protein
MPRGRAALLAAAALAGAGSVLLAQRLARVARRRLERSTETADGHDYANESDGRGVEATRAWLEAALWRTIPLTRAMRVRVPTSGARPEEPADEDTLPLCVAAPLHENRNIHGTAFAGSLHATAVLAGWGWLELHARRVGGRLGEATVVVRGTQMRYFAPVTSDFVATAEPPSAQELATCVRAKRGARVRAWEGVVCALCASAAALCCAQIDERKSARCVCLSARVPAAQLPRRV